ncbi:family 2 glycosyl transferase [Serratia sp. S1B]|nr:family 2 glycosyl transferase [Serratia sp. S1B]
MFNLSVCILTHNSARLLEQVLPPLVKIADEIIIVDSGSSDATLTICQQFGLVTHHHPYATHGAQMNHAIALASNDWVLCMDSDEILDDEVVAAILALKAGQAPAPDYAWCLPRYWYVLGQEVRTIYPVSSPDYPVRLFNRTIARFNDRPVDDQVVGAQHSARLPGRVRHDTFYSLHEVFSKLNNYTTRLVKYQRVKPSLGRGIISAIGAFFKWYLFSGAWRTGKVGVVTGLYATFYSFLKYFKAWYADGEKK